MISLKIRMKTSNMRKIFFLICCLWSAVLMGQLLPASDSIALEALQSVHDEAQPLLSTDGKFLYFSRKGDLQNVGGNNHFDIWLAFRNSDESWGKPIHMPLPLNNRSDNFVVAAGADASSLYLLEGNQGLPAKLVYTQKQGRSWSAPKAVVIQHFSPLPSTQYAMADQNTVLFLSSDLEEGYGYGSGDIYVSRKIADTLWTEPVNLGEKINTNSEECHAFLAADNKTLYFLRKGTEQSDNMTIMVSQRLGTGWTDWSEPKATELILDPSLFDTYFSVEASEKMIYISGRKEANSDLALFAFSLPEQYQPGPVVHISGQLVDAQSGKYLYGNVLLESLNSFRETQHQQTNNKGLFQFVLSKESSFLLSANVPGYFAKSEIITHQSFEELDQDETKNEEADALPSSPELDQLLMRLNQLDKAISDLEQKRAITQLAIDKHKRTNWSPSKNQEQLAAIEAKYQEALGLDPVKVEITTSGDSELDAMKRVFRKHNEVQSPTSENTTTKSIATTEESQLEATKKKFNDLNNKTPAEGTDEKEVAVLSTSSLSQTNFDLLVEQSRKELEQELGEQVVKELRADLVKEVSFKIQAGMDAQSKERYANTLQRKTEMLETEVKKALRKKYTKEEKRELQTELLEEVETELRDLLREEVKKDLRVELEEEVKNELRLELEYLLTKEMAEDTKKEVATLIKQLKKGDIAAPARYYGGSIAADAQPKRAAKASQEIILELHPLASGQVIPLHNIFFEANSDIWKDSSLPELNRVYDLLNNNPTLRVEIGGHSNGWCQTDFANKLSSDRANAVVGFLMERGITPERISGKGYGKTQPLVTNDSVENCKKNQRLELKILN
jgi:outer membrane protein OmpA-like peptidoglycan-associated protein